MFKRIKRLRLYFFSLLMILTCATIFLFSTEKVNGFILLNIYHTKILDVFFNIVTNLGDGILSLLLGIVLIVLRKKKKASCLLLAYASSSLIAQIAKRIFNLPRPRLLLEQLNIAYANFVTGVTLHDHHSFPSGHTTSAFAMATVLVLVFKKNKISTACILLAIVVGYSRIYLAQHFLLDVLAGAILGTTCALLSYHQVYDLKLFRSRKVAKRLKKLRVATANSN
ncbi:phosphatase PAP2 family protein [Pedobacter aquatilis]|uniref:phosphatase PAP2 family protein n=1 Tax=Pedobacter aquatilis TaxID=351343 RepID=UPI002930155C|nr:phosphatase PAP2 family protein [Pedobacter aquatilis]